MARLEFGPNLTRKEQAEIDSDLQKLRSKFDARIAANVRTEKKKKPIFNVADLPHDRVQIRDKVMDAYRKIEEERTAERGRKSARNRLIGPHAEPRKLQDGDPTKMVTTRHVLRQDLPALKTNRVEQPSMLSDEFVNEALDAAHNAVNERNGLPNTDLRLYLHENFPKAFATTASFRHTNNAMLGSWKQSVREKLASDIAGLWEVDTHARDVSSTGTPRTQEVLIERDVEPISETGLAKPSQSVEVVPVPESDTQLSRFPSTTDDDGYLRPGQSHDAIPNFYRKIKSWLSREK